MVNYCVLVILETIVKRMASVKNGTPISQVDGENLKRDYARMVVLIEDQLVEYKAGVQLVLFKGKPLKEWYKGGGGSTRIVRTAVGTAEGGLQ